MALTTVSFTTTFNFATKKFNFADTTNYVSQGVASNDVAICFKIVDPLGNTFYNNTNFSSPDISPSISLTNNLIDILLDSGGKIVQGQYIITASYKVSLDTLYPEHTVTLTNTITLKYTAPTVTVTLESNCVTPLLKSTDTTEYRVNGITPTIVRVHTIFFPAVLQLADLVGSGTILQTSTFYTNEHSSKVESTLTYAFTGYSVSDVVSGTAIIDVVCDAQLCDIYCCISAEWNRYLSFKTTNKSQSNIHLNNWMKMLDAAGQIGIALTCGKTTDINNLTSFILELGNCQVGCGCADGDPVPVVGLGGLGSVNVAVSTCGNGIIVTSSTVGGITTYQVCLSTSIVNKVNASYNTTLVAGTNISITPVIDANGNIQYTVTGTTQTPPDMITLLLRIQYQAGSIALFTETDRKITGTLFKAPTYEVVNNSLGHATWITKNNGFIIKDFLNTITTEKIKCVMDINKFSLQYATITIDSRSGGGSIDVTMVNIDTASDGEIFFRIHDFGNKYQANEILENALFDATISVIITR